MAQALMSLSSDLSGWGKDQQKEQQETDFLRGQADALGKTEQGWAEGVRSGEIPANASKWYQRGAATQFGNAAGFSLEGKFASAFEQWEGKNDTDPGSFDKWFADTSRGAVSNRDPYFLKGVMPHLKEIHNRYQDRWVKLQDQNAQFRAQAGVGAGVAGAIDSTILDWKQDAQRGNLYQPDIPALGRSIEAIQQGGLRMGMRQDQVDKVVVDAIQAKVLQYRDPRLLKLFEIKSASGQAIKDTPYGMDTKLKTEQTLTSLWKQEASEERLKQEREDKLAANQGKAAIVEQILKDPKAPLDERHIAAVQKVDGDFKLDIMRWRDQVLQSPTAEGGTADDPRKVNELFADLLAGGDGMGKLMSAIRAGDIKSQDSVSKAVAFIKSVQEFGNSKSSILTTAAARMYITQVEEQGIDSKLSKNRILGAPPVLTPEARQALFNYRFGLMQWGIQNPNASVLDQEKEAATRGEAILRSFKAAAPGKASTFSVPQSMQSIPQTPFIPENVGDAARKVLEQVITPPQPPAPGPQPTHQAPQPSGSLPPDLRGAFTPDQVDKAAAWGQQNGRTTEQVLRQWQKQFGGPQPEPGNSPAAPSAPAPGPRSELPFAPASYGAANLPPAVQAIARQAAETLGVRLTANTPGGGGGGAAAEPATAANGSMTPSSARSTRILNKEGIGPLVQQVAQANGMDPNELAVMVDIESSGRPGLTAPNGKYHGLLQLSQAEFSKFGGDDIFDARQNLEAGAKVILQKKARFEAEFGRPPTITELYMMHQQGEAGMRAHVRNPDQEAWRSMAGTGEGRQRGEGWARQAIWQNVPSDMKARFGSVDNISSREFLAIWTSKLLGVSYDRALAMGVGGARADATQD